MTRGTVMKAAVKQVVVGCKGSPVMTLGFLRQEELAMASRGGRWRPVISLDSVTYLPRGLSRALHTKHPGSRTACSLLRTGRRPAAASAPGCSSLGQGGHAATAGLWNQHPSWCCGSSCEFSRNLKVETAADSFITSGEKAV